MIAVQTSYIQSTGSLIARGKSVIVVMWSTTPTMALMASLMGRRVTKSFEATYGRIRRGLKLQKGRGLTGLIVQLIHLGLNFQLLLRFVA